MRAVLWIALCLPGTICQAQVRSANQVWEDSCGYCHGKGIGPELRGRVLSFDIIKAWTRYGLRQMPAFAESAISDEELAALGEWMATQPALVRKENAHATP